MGQWQKHLAMLYGALWVVSVFMIAHGGSMPGLWFGPPPAYPYGGVVRACLETLLQSAVLVLSVSLAAPLARLAAALLSVTVVVVQFMNLPAGMDGGGIPIAQFNWSAAVLTVTPCVWLVQYLSKRQSRRDTPRN